MSPSPRKGQGPQFFARVYSVQDATWHGGMPLTRPHCARWGPSSHPSPRKGGTAPPSFRPMSIGPSGCMHQYITLYEGRLQPSRHCVRWGPSSPNLKGHNTPTQFSARVYFGQTAGWMKTPCGTEVDLDPGHIVLEGDPAPPAKGAQQPPSFLLWPRSPISAAAELLVFYFVIS